MEILAKCKCPKCGKAVYPRPSEIKTYSQIGNSHCFTVELTCAYCNTHVGGVSIDYYGSEELPERPEVKD